MEIYQILRIKIFFFIFLYPENYRAAGKNRFQRFKRKCVRTFSGFPPPMENQLPFPPSEKILVAPLYLVKHLLKKCVNI
jgi:hypothetical protein